MKPLLYNTAIYKDERCVHPATPRNPSDAHYCTCPLLPAHPRIAGWVWCEQGCGAIKAVRKAACNPLRGCLQARSGGIRLRFEDVRKACARRTSGVQHLMLATARAWSAARLATTGTAAAGQLPDTAACRQLPGGFHASPRRTCASCCPRLARSLGAPTDQGTRDVAWWGWNHCSRMLHAWVDREPKRQAASPGAISCFHRHTSWIRTNKR